MVEDLTFVFINSAGVDCRLIPTTLPTRDDKGKGKITVSQTNEVSFEINQHQSIVSGGIKVGHGTASCIQHKRKAPEDADWGTVTKDQLTLETNPIYRGVMRREVNERILMERRARFLAQEQAKICRREAEEAAKDLYRAKEKLSKALFELMEELKAEKSGASGDV